MQRRVRTALFCCLALADLGMLALVPAGIHWLSPDPASLHFSAPASVPSESSEPDEQDRCDDGRMRNSWCEPRYTRQI